MRTGDGMGCGSECFGEELGCQESLDCLGLSAPTAVFKEGPYGTGFRDTAGPVILPTTRGDWSFETFYDGNDNYIFLNTTANGSDFSNFVTTLWESNFKFFLWKLPLNTHLFFMSFDASNDAVLAMETKILESLSKLIRKNGAGGKNGFISSPPHLRPFQAGLEKCCLKRVGSGLLWTECKPFAPSVFCKPLAEPLNCLSWPTNSSITISRPSEKVVLSGEDPFIVPVVEGEEVKNQVFDVSLPDSLSMGNFNRLSIDLGTYCADHLTPIAVNGTTCPTCLLVKFRRSRRTPSPRTVNRPLRRFLRAEEIWVCARTV